MCSEILFVKNYKKYRALIVARADTRGSGAGGAALVGARALTVVSLLGHDDYRLAVASLLTCRLARLDTGGSGALTGALIGALLLAAGLHHHWLSTDWCTLLLTVACRTTGLAGRLTTGARVLLDHVLRLAVATTG